MAALLPIVDVVVPPTPSCSTVDFRATRLGAPQVFCDAASALLTSCILAVPVTIIDTSIIEGIAEGRGCTSAGILSRMAEKASASLRSPHRLKGYRHMVTVYTLTYAAANGTQSIYDVRRQGSSPGVVKALTTTAVNAPVSMWKDAYYARVFGTLQPRGFPPLTLALFLLRDILSMYFSFTLPSIVTDTVAKAYPHRFSREALHTAATVLCPVSAQVVVSVIHILAFDCFNRRHDVTFRSRLGVVREKYAETTGVRMGRVLVAYGLGSLVNLYLRARLHTMFV